jgi:hypothetical protein
MWEDFREGRLRLDCACIQLIQNGTKLAFEGPGEVWQDHDGVIQFKCFAQGSPDALQAMLRRLGASHPGLLIPREHYFAIRIKTFGGEQWKCSDVNVWFNSSFVTNQVVATGKLLAMTREEHVDRMGNSLRLLFRNQEFALWKSLTNAKIHCKKIGCTIDITVDGSAILIKVSSETPLAPNFEVRVVEALRYVLAKVIHVAIVQREGEGLCETSLISSARTTESGLLPPLMANSEIEFANLRRLVECYLTFVHSETQAEFVHPCSAHVRNACESSANAMEAEAVGLCVAVEGLAKLLPYCRNTTSDKVIEWVQKTVRRWLKRRAVDEGIQNRVNGLLSQLMSARVKDRVQPLIETGYLDPTAFATWEKLRNKRVHNSSYKLEEVDEFEVQAFMDRIHQVYTCMYQITFALIGYEGAFTNYAARHFPVQEYPMKGSTTSGML